MTKMQPSIEGFADWLERQEPEGKYNWANLENCACSQYGKSLGLEKFTFPNREYMEDIAHYQPHTFGACAKRARAAL